MSDPPGETFRAPGQSCFRFQWKKNRWETAGRRRFQRSEGKEQFRSKRAPQLDPEYPEKEREVTTDEKSTERRVRLHSFPEDLPFFHHLYSASDPSGDLFHRPGDLSQAGKHVYFCGHHGLPAGLPLCRGHDYDASSEDATQLKQSGLGLTRKLDGKVDLKSEIIEFSVIPSDEHISKKLQIEEGSFVYHIIRKRVVDDLPYCLEITYMPISIIPNLKLEHLKGSIYQYIEKELKLKIQSSHKTIRAHLSSPLEQEQLGLKEYEPYIEVEQTAYLSSGIIFEYSFTRYHYNKFELQTVTVQ